MERSSEQAPQQGDPFPLDYEEDVDGPVWSRELDPFLPTRIFDVHSHIFLAEHRPGAEESRNPSHPTVCNAFPLENYLRSMRRMFPGRELGALLFGLWLWNIKSTNALPRRWCKLLRSSPALRRGLKRAKSVLLPLCLASALVLWQQMQVAATLAYQARFHDLPLLTSLILSGLLPLRLLLALRPPYKPANLTMGVLVFAFYLKMLWPLLGQA